MAVLEATVASPSLMRTINIMVILPADKMQMNGTYMPEVNGFRTLYLLHGILGSEKDWIYRTNLLRYVEERNIAVVMPAGENAFYLDQPDVHALYSQMISNDLVEVTRRMFPLSRRREDTFIGGLSMGGYGALYNGLSHPETFSRIIALSAADRTEDSEKLKDDTLFLDSRSFYTRMFGGSLEGIKESRYNIRTLAAEMARDGQALPEIYLACGLQDGLLEITRSIHKGLKSSGYRVEYHETRGKHDWDFWDKHIQSALNWIEPKKTASMHSGNVGKV